MSGIGISASIKKNKGIIKALLASTRKSETNQIQRGEAVFLFQTPTRKAKRVPQLIGVVRDADRDIGTIYVNIYDDGTDNCLSSDALRLRSLSTGDWATVPSMRTRTLEFEICDWDRATGKLTTVRGKLTIREWQPIDSTGSPIGGRSKDASIVKIEYDGEIVLVR